MATTKGTPMQRHGITTELRDHAEDFADFWNAATRDERIDVHEMRQATDFILALVPKAAHVDDAVRLTVSVLRIGDENRKVKARIREHTDLHGPIQMSEYRKRKNRRDGNRDGAA